MLAYEQTDVMDFFSPPQSLLQGDAACKKKGHGSSAWCGILFDGESVLGFCSGSVPTIGWGGVSRQT